MHHVFDTKKQALDAGYDQANPRILIQDGPLSVDIRDVSEGNTFGYDFAVVAELEQDASDGLPGVPLRSPNLAESVTVHLKKERNRIGKMGCSSQMFIPGAIEQAMDEARIWAGIVQVEFDAIHRAIALGNFGDRIWVYRDESDGTLAGGHVVTGSQETPGDVATGASGPVARLTARGLGGLNDELYYSGFAHEDDDGLWRYDATGELVGGEGEWRSVVEGSIRDGEWIDYYDELRAEILRQWAE